MDKIGKPVCQSPVANKGKLKTWEVPKFEAGKTVCAECGVLLIEQDTAQGKKWIHYSQARSVSLVMPHDPVPVPAARGPVNDDTDSFGNRSSRYR